MANLVFKEGTILFAGYYPDDVEAAKAYAAKYGYTKEDIKIYKESYQYKGTEFTQVLIKTLRPIAIDCGVIGCPNHTPTEAGNGN